MVMAGQSDLAIFLSHFAKQILVLSQFVGQLLFGSQFFALDMKDLSKINFP